MYGHIWGICPFAPASCDQAVSARDHTAGKKSGPIGSRLSFSADIPMNIVFINMTMTR
jgi:hypothetical protein